MSKKVLGILTPIGFTVLLFLILIITGVIVSSTSSDGWAALGAIMMVFMLGGILFIIFLIVSIVMYSKKHTDYWLGSLYGYAGVVGVSLTLGLLITIYNALIA